ncbi:PrsW family intramembrane metalloprotease [Paenibacillus sp. HWE-109]|uniref:PrsW family intramembrane metalloprotease n=1 Tax=Paenibacillus sp. HWE-109 TaxID=1306526 RepID=UPI001EE0350F|nr:PrsW family intramembrane metalloprotease [Paenibacillus sp. HWE-109]UKS24532.1 PrsW family intramembrane metalloprotease [Paenibacillus sp. HWE-109]
MEMNIKTSTQPSQARRRILLSLLAAAAWLVGIVWVSSQIGVGGIFVGLPVSVLVTLPMVGVFVWLGRWKQEPAQRLLPAFVWGAAGATFLSLVSQEGLLSLLNAKVGTDFTSWFQPLVITPVTEEVFKGLFLIWLLIYCRRHIIGLLDGVIYGGFVGAGFAFTEQILYFGKIITQFAGSNPTDSGAAGLLIAGLALRALFVPFMHSFLVAIFGLGIAAAAGQRHRSAQVGFAGVGLVFAVALHGVWDWAALAGKDPLMLYKIYAAVMVPLFLSMVILALVLRRRQGRAVVTAMPILARDGEILAHEVVSLSSLKQRRQLRRNTRRRYGRPAARAIGRYQAEVSALGIMTLRAETTGNRDGLAEQANAVEDARSTMPESGLRR